MKICKLHRGLHQVLQQGYFGGAQFVKFIQID